MTNTAYGTVRSNNRAIGKACRVRTDPDAYLLQALPSTRSRTLTPSGASAIKRQFVDLHFPASAMEAASVLI